MKYNEIIKNVGRGKNSATDIDEDAAYTLYGAMLDGDVPELELGALLVAFRIKGESEPEMLGFYRAMQSRLARLQPPAGRPLPVVIPTYNGARKQGNLTPLLALILQRLGLPVLVQGITEDARRVTSREVFAELGIKACASVAEAQQRLDAGEVAFVPVSVLSAGLERLLQLRWRLGVRNSTHTLAKLLDPFAGQSLRLVSVTHPEYLTRMAEFFRATNARALLLRGCEGEAYANPKRCPCIACYEGGREQVLIPAESGVLGSVPELPESLDAGVTARWIEQALAGDVPLPPPLLAQAACCLAASGGAPDLVAAMHTVADTFDCSVATLLRFLEPEPELTEQAHD